MYGSNALWRTVIKTPLTSLQKQPKATSPNPVKFVQMTLRLIPKILYTINVIVLISKQLTMIYTIVLERTHIKYIITAQAIGIYNAVRSYFLSNNRQQGFALSTGYHKCTNLAFSLIQRFKDQT